MLRSSDVLCTKYFFKINRLHAARGLEEGQETCAVVENFAWRVATFPSLENVPIVKNVMNILKQKQRKGNIDFKYFMLFLVFLKKIWA